MISRIIGALVKFEDDPIVKTRAISFSYVILFESISTLRFLLDTDLTLAKNSVWEFFSYLVQCTLASVYQYTSQIGRFKLALCKRTAQQSSLFCHCN